MLQGCEHPGGFRSLRQVPHPPSPARTQKIIGTSEGIYQKNFWHFAHGGPGPRTHKRGSSEVKRHLGPVQKMRETGLASNLPPKKPPITQKKVFLIQNLPPSDPSSHHLAHFCTSGAKKHICRPAARSAGVESNNNQNSSMGMGMEGCCCCCCCLLDPLGMASLRLPESGKNTLQPQQRKTHHEAPGKRSRSQKCRRKTHFQAL